MAEDEVLKKWETLYFDDLEEEEVEKFREFLEDVNPEDFGAG